MPYRFFTPAPAGVLPTYRPTWVPEGYRESRSYQDERQQIVLYQRGEDESDSFIFDYMFYSDSTEFGLLWKGDEYELRELQVNRFTAHFYQSVDGSQTNNLLWFDEHNHILFEINAPLEFDVMVHIAESVDLVK